MHTSIFSFCILKHTKTRAISAHRQRTYAFRSFSSFSLQHQSLLAQSGRAYACRNLLIFTLTAAVTTSYKQIRGKSAQDHRVSARTWIDLYEFHFIQHSAVFVNCLTPMIIRHHVHHQYHSSENSTRACQNPFSTRKLVHVRPVLTQDMQFNRVEQTMRHGCNSEQHNTRISNATHTPVVFQRTHHEHTCSTVILHLRTASQT